MSEGARLPTTTDRETLEDFRSRWPVERVSTGSATTLPMSEAEKLAAEERERARGRVGFSEESS